MTMHLSFLPSDSSAFLSSGLTLISPRNFMNVSLLVPICSRYCCTVMPCANLSLVTISSPCAPRLPHRCQIYGERRDFPLVGVLDHQHHPALGVDLVGRKFVHALRRVPPVVLAERGALVLHEARLDLLGSRQERRGIEPREIRLGAAAQRHPEVQLALGVLDRRLNVLRRHLLAAEC